MRLVRFKGANPGTTRGLRSQDFASLDIKDQDGVEWNDENNHTVELKNAVADALVEKLGEEFEIISESDAAKSDE